MPADAEGQSAEVLPMTAGTESSVRKEVTTWTSRKGAVNFR
jgi:hypothetical protein